MLFNFPISLLEGAQLSSSVLLINKGLIIHRRQGQSPSNLRLKKEGYHRCQTSRTGMSKLPTRQKV